jgi:hypothetical protein
MRGFLIVPLACALLAVPVAVLAGGSEGGFDGVVHSIESRYHVRATRIPFMGLMSFISARATHGGVGNIHVADFEHFDAQVDGEELDAMVEQKLGAGWERMIRETSRSGCDQTLIFVHPEGARMGLFIVDADGHELNVVQVSVDPDYLSESIGHYGHHHSDSDKDADSKDGDDEDDKE